MRYINKQRHAKTCGPVALVNCFKKLGMKMPYKKAVRLCGGKKAIKKGTSLILMLELLRAKGFDVTYTKCKLSEARFFARQPDFAVIACHFWRTSKKSKGHYTMIDEEGNFINNGGVKRYKKSMYKNTKKKWDHRWNYIIIKEDHEDISG